MLLKVYITDLYSLNINGSKYTVLDSHDCFYFNYKDHTREGFYQANNFDTEESALLFIRGILDNKELSWHSYFSGTHVIQKEIYI